MRDEGDLHSLAQTLGSAALGIGLGLGVLIIGFLVSRAALPESNVAAATTGTPAATAARSSSPTSPPAAPAPTPSPAATPRPTATPDPLVVSAFEGQGLQLAALTMPAGYTVRSPVAGTVTIVLYQYLDGEIRTDSNVATEPSYPYLFVRSADREIKLRPGAVERDVELLVTDGQTVLEGTPLFRTRTTAASSWRTFYDPEVSAQVVVSASVRASGEGIDPVPLFKK